MQLHGLGFRVLGFRVYECAALVLNSQDRLDKARRVDQRTVYGSEHVGKGVRTFSSTGCASGAALKTNTPV